jgi:aspartate aminotransferase
LISREIRKLMQAGTTIREVWSRGLRLKQIHGAENVADMTLGNPVAPPPEALLAALQDIVAHPGEDLHRYTPHAGHPEVRERIAEHLDRRDLLPGVKRDHVVVTAGASAATNIVLRAVLDPGDEVLLLAPYFPDYPAHVLNHRGVPVVIPTNADFLPDLNAIDRALGERTRAVIVNHPNNPSGRQYPETLLRELASLLRRSGRRHGRAIYLISDEPYREIRYTTEPFTSPARVYENGVMAYSFSKSHSIPGERIGYLALNPDNDAAEEIVGALALSSRILGFPNAPSLWQHVIARCLDAVVEVKPLRRNHDRLLGALREKAYEVTPADGTFYLFPRTPGGDDEGFVRRAMEDLLLLVPGGTFGCGGFFRIAYCVDDRTVDLAVERLPHAARSTHNEIHGGSTDGE